MTNSSGVTPISADSIPVVISYRSRNILEKNAFASLSFDAIDALSCHAILKVLCARFNMDGILYATAYTAFTATPMTAVMTNLSDTRMTHMDRLLGTIGQE